MTKQTTSKARPATQGISFGDKTLHGFPVRLAGKKVGEIRERQGGFRYYPKGSASPGEWFATLAEVKRSLA